MRLKKSLINIIVSVITQIIAILIGFISQKVFAMILGKEILGLNGLFNNVISMLSIAEMGIGTAIIYALYKPILDKDKEKIKSLMLFYKSCYIKIAVIILFVGLLIFPFIDKIVGDNDIIYNVKIIYILFLIETVISYLLTYKRSILYADQKNYVLEIIHLLYLVVLNVLEIIILVFTKNYILYLFIKIVMRLLENVVINIISVRLYPFLKEKNVQALDKKEKSKFYEKMKGLFFHKISWNIINGTDNIIISSFIGIVWVGLYSNYLLIINTLEKVASQIFSAMTGSIGNLVVSETKEKSYDIYKKLDLFQLYLYSTLSVEIYLVSESFITIWLGKDYILNDVIVLVMCISFFIQGIRRNICMFKDATGIFYEDRKMPIIASIINIIVSIILVNICGIVGVIIGTITCYLFLHILSYSKYVYEKVFERKRTNYIIEFFMKIMILISELIIAYFVKTKILFSNPVIQILFNSTIGIIITTISVFIFFYNTEEFKYFKKLICTIARNFFMKIRSKKINT